MANIPSEPSPSLGPSTHPTQILCVYALSGGYGLLPRILYYCTLAFAIFGRSREWLVIGALVSALTYAGTTAVHIMALVNSKTNAFDLDLLGAWAVLSTGALAYIAMVHWSSTLKSSRARIVMVSWGILVGISLIFGRSVLFDTPLSSPEPACYSSVGQILQYPIQLANPQFNCTYKCFSTTKPMRQSSELIAVPLSVLVSKYSHLAVVLVGPIQFAAYAAITFDSHEHTPSQFYTRRIMRHFNPKHNEDITKLIYNASQERWYGGYLLYFTYISRSRWSMTKLLICSFVVPWIVFALAIDVLSLPLLITNVVLNELDLLRSGLPTNEANRAIGQWGPIVASALVVYAAILNRGLEEWDERKRRRKEARDEEKTEERRTGSAEEVRGDLGLGQTDGQESGVVKPGIAHVQTLKDVDEFPW